MKKFYINKKELNEEELKTGHVSYGRIIDRYIDNLVLCNNIINFDDSILDNATGMNYNYEEYPEIYQFFICDVNEQEKEQLEEWGFLFSYSDILDINILLVDHYGTNWFYVMTDVEWTENYEEC